MGGWNCVRYLTCATQCECDGRPGRAETRPEDKVEGPHLVRVSMAEEQVGCFDVSVNELMLMDVLQNVQLDQVTGRTTI